MNTKSAFESSLDDNLVTALETNHVLALDSIEKDISARRIVDNFFTILDESSIKNGIKKRENLTLECNKKESYDVLGTQNLLFWKSLSKIYYNIYKVSDFPPPTTSFLTEKFIALGTSKGNVLFFNHNEFIMLRLVPDPEHESLNKPITGIKISNDETHVIASTIDGDIIFWDLKQVEEESTEHPLKSIKSWFHILATEKGTYASNFGFLGTGNDTILVSYNNKTSKSVVSTMFYKIRLAQKQKWLSKESSFELISKQVLFKNTGNNNIQLAVFSDCTITTELITAVLTDRSIQVVSFNKEYPILFNKVLEMHLPKETDSLQWLKIDLNTLILCFNRGNIFCGMTFEILGEDGNTSTWKLVDEFRYTLPLKITSFNLIGKSLSFILLENNQLALLDLNNGNVIQQSNILIDDIIQPIENSIAFSGNRLVSVITKHGISLGTFASWQNVILQELRSKKPLLALEFLETIAHHKNKALKQFLNVPDSEKDNNSELRSTFLSLVQAALIHIVKKKKNSNDQYPPGDLQELKEFFIKTARMDYFFNNNELNASLSIIENDFFDYSASLKKFFYSGLATMFNDIEEQGAYLPPVLVNGVLENIDSLENCEAVIKNITKFDISCFNVDLVIKYFIKTKDFTNCIYIWTNLLNDFETPFCDLISCISKTKDASEVFGKICESDIPLLKTSLIAYLKNIFEGTMNRTSSESTDMSLVFIKFLLAASCIKFSENSKEILYTRDKKSDEPTFPYFRFLLELDPREFLGIFNSYFSTNSQIRIKETGMFLDILLDVLRQYLCEKDTAPAIIKAIGLFSSLFISSQHTQFGIVKNLDLIFKALTSSEMFPIESEAALFLLIKNCEFEFLTNNIFSTLKRLKFFKALMYAYYLKGEYFSCLQVSLDLNMDTVFDLIKLCYEQSSDCENDTSFTSTDNELCYRNTDKLEAYELEGLVSENFERLCSIDLQKSVELIFLYDFDFENVLRRIYKSKNNYSLKLKIIEVIINDSRYQLPYFLFKEYIELIVKSGLPHSTIDKQLDAILQKETFSKYNIDSIVFLLREHRHYKPLVNLLMLSNDTESALAACFAATPLHNNLSQNVTEDDTIYFVNLSFEICKKSHTLQNWSTFFLYYFKIHQETTYDDLKKISLNALMNATVQLSLISENDKACSLLQVVTNILENNSILLEKLSSCSELLQDFCFTYKIEISFLKMLLHIFNTDAANLANSSTKAKLKGWLVNSQSCPICKLNIYGNNGDYTVVFRCGHHFHNKCYMQKSSNEHDCCICNC